MSQLSRVNTEERSGCLAAAYLAEHGAEEEGTQATSEVLPHAGKAVLLQHAHHHRTAPDARKHAAPLGHLRTSASDLQCNQDNFHRYTH